MFKPTLNQLLCSGIIAALLLTLALPASALTDAWSVDVNTHTAVQRTYKQGEYISAYVTLRDGYAPLDLTGATAKFLWYTNSTDNLWWTNSATITSPSSGEVSFDWQPSMDTGASTYYYWVGIWPSGSTSPVWRVNGTIRLLPSPGFTPNALPLPVHYLDFDAIQYTNGPWATTNALTTAISVLQSVKPSALWSTSTNYMDGTGIMYKIITIPHDTLTCIDHTADGEQTYWIGESWTDIGGGIYVSDSHGSSDLDYYPTWYTPYGAQFQAKSVLEDYWYIDVEGNFSPGSTFQIHEMNYAAEITTLQHIPAGVYTNIITRAATTNDVATAVAPLATTNDVAAAIAAITVNFTDCLLYTLNSTNYYFRWSETNNTYIVTGVPQ